MAKTTAKAEIAELTLPVSGRDHTQGPDAGPVTLVEYGDYECPYCGQAYPIIKNIQKHFGDRLRFVFRNFPVAQVHPHAEHAAEAAECAGAQERFWEMHDRLYEHQQELDDNHLRQHASALGMDIARFEDEMARHVHAGRVREDFMSGIRSGVNGTPTFYINGMRYDDSWDEGTLQVSIEQAIADRSLDDREVAATVTDEGDRGGASDGLESDAAGNIYSTNYEHNAILRRRPGGQWETVAHDPRLLWPDTLSLAADGYLYVTANQLHRQARFHKGRDLRRKPYTLFRIRVDTKPVRL